MYAIVENDEILKLISHPQPITIGNVQYSQKVFTLSSVERLASLGIYEVHNNDENFRDEQYFDNTQPQYEFVPNYENSGIGRVVRTYGTATPRQLEDIRDQDQDGVDLSDQYGRPVFIKGLKDKHKSKIKEEASALLTPTDWYVVKQTEVEEYTMPLNVSTFRSQVRSQSDIMEQQIDNCNTVEELQALYVYSRNDDGDLVRPLAEFPILL